MDGRTSGHTVVAQHRGFRSKLNTRRSSSLQALPSQFPFPLPSRRPRRGLPRSSLSFASLFCARQALGLICPQVWPVIRLSGYSHNWYCGCRDVCATSPSGPFAEKCLSPFRPGRYQCHGGDVCQGNPSPPTCMRHSTQLTQPNERPVGQSARRSFSFSLLGETLGLVMPAPRIISELPSHSNNAHFPAENAWP